MNESLRMTLILVRLHSAPLACSLAVAQDAKTQFEKTVRPLFERKCFQCHSSKADELKGNLKLETLELILKGGDQGPAVVAGDKDSFLLAGHPLRGRGFQMPPSGRLEDKDVALIEKWVKTLGDEAKRTR